MRAGEPLEPVARPSTVRVKDGKTGRPLCGGTRAALRLYEIEAKDLAPSMRRFETPLADIEQVEGEPSRAARLPAARPHLLSPCPRALEASVARTRAHGAARGDAPAGRAARCDARTDAQGDLVLLDKIACTAIIK